MMKTIHSNVDEYLDYYRKHPKLFNNRRHLLIKNIVYPTIDKLKKGQIYFDVDAYEKCIDYCERRFYPLFPYQKFIYAFIFMYDDDSKIIPYFATFFIMMGRGNGKDGMIMPLSNFLQTHYYGVKKYNVDIIANAEDQANDSFKVVYDMLEENKLSMKKFFYWNKVYIVNRKTGAILRYNTSNAKTKDGKKTGLLIFNEYHAYEDTAQIRVFKSGLGKIPHPRTIVMTTNGYVRGGPLDNELDIINGILNGEPNGLRIFPFICEIDEMEQGDDPEMWELSNPSIQFMPILKNEIHQHYLRAKSDPSERAEFYTKRMNKPVANEERALTSWDNILRASYDDSVEDWMSKKKVRYTPDLSRKNALVGIDFASVNDFASAGFLFFENDEYIWRSMTWICKQSKYFHDIKFPFINQGSNGYQDFTIVDEPFIREETITTWIVENSHKYNVLKIVMDSHRYPIMRKRFEEIGFDEETRENKNGFVRKIRLPGSMYNIVIPQIQRDFIKGIINIGDSAIMRWSINNTAVKTVGQNVTYEKIEERFRKNDTYMAFVHAYSAKDLLDKEVVTFYF